MDEIGATLRAMRLKHKLTQGELASLTGISRGHISLIENNNPRAANTQLSTLIKLFEPFELYLVIYFSRTGGKRRK